MEVCSLSREVMLPVSLNFYSLHYRATFAFSILLYPHFCRLALRLAFPRGRNTGLPRFAISTRWVRSRLYAGGAMSAVAKNGAATPGHSPFGPSLSAGLACFP